MKSFFASLLCLLLLLATWTVYINYSDKEIHEFADAVENSILPDVEYGNWDHAVNKFDQLEKNWHKYRKVACFFFSTDKLNDADYSIARAGYYIKAEDVSNATGELSCLKEQLKFLHENESLTLGNLF